VTAYVVEASQFSILIAHQQERFTSQVYGEVVALRGQLITMSHDLPCPMKNPLALLLKSIRIKIEARRQGPGTRDLRIDERAEQVVLRRLHDLSRPRNSTATTFSPEASAVKINCLLQTRKSNVRL
jgi:hypothetical protein